MNDNRKIKSHCSILSMKNMPHRMNWGEYCFGICQVHAHHLGCVTDRKIITKSRIVRVLRRMTSHVRHYVCGQGQYDVRKRIRI